MINWFLERINMCDRLSDIMTSRIWRVFFFTMMLHFYIHCVITLYQIVYYNTIEITKRWMGVGQISIKEEVWSERCDQVNLMSESEHHYLTHNLFSLSWNFSVFTSQFFSIINVFDKTCQFRLILVMLTTSGSQVGYFFTILHSHGTITFTGYCIRLNYIDQPGNIGEERITSKLYYDFFSHP